MRVSSRSFGFSSHPVHPFPSSAPLHFIPFLLFSLSLSTLLLPLLTFILFHLHPRRTLYLHSRTTTTAPPWLAPNPSSLQSRPTSSVNQ